MAADLGLSGIAKGWSGRPVLQHLDLAVAAGEVVAVLGPSGSGKTTLLRIVAGLEVPDEGQVLIDGVDSTHLPPSRRDLGMVFQHSGLLPHLTAAENIGFGLKARRVSAHEIEHKVARAAELAGCAELLARSVTHLSGGERQRVALARALVREPSLVLLDEPLSSLDVHVRLAMRTEVRRSLRAAGSTTVYVTHDQDEAFAVADRVAVLWGGGIAQVGTLEDLYDRPASVDVASFVGSPRINLVPIDGSRWPSSWVLPAAGGPVARRIVAGIRPADVELGTAGGAVATVVGVEAAEDRVLVRLDLAGVALTALASRSRRPEVGELVETSVHPSRILLFDAETGDAIGLSP